MNELAGVGINTRKQQQGAKSTGMATNLTTEHNQKQATSPFRLYVPRMESIGCSSETGVEVSTCCRPPTF